MITIDPRQNAEFIGDMPRIRGSAFPPWQISDILQSKNRVGFLKSWAVIIPIHSKRSSCTKLYIYVHV